METKTNKCDICQLNNHCIAQRDDYDCEYGPIEHKWVVINALDHDEYAGIACGNMYIVQDMRKEYAKHICRCVNSHTKLLEAAKQIIADYDDRGSHKVTEGSIGKLERAIAEAESEG